MSQVTILGIDPGKTGGIGLIQFEPGKPTSVHSEVWKMPETEREVFDLLKSRVKSQHSTSIHAWIERVASRPQQGVAGTFKFGKNYGLLRGLLIALEVPFESVPPGVWQRKLGCLTGGDKTVNRAKAQELFPSISITNATAEALWIAEYGRRVHLS